VGMISSMRMMKIRIGIVPVNDVRLLLMYDTVVESFI
jgi:hypothetical protein